MKFSHFDINTTRQPNKISTRLVLGPENPIIVDTPIYNEDSVEYDALAIVKHLDSVKELLEDVIERHLK